MTESKKQVLRELHTDHLIYLIEQLYHSQSLIGEVLVDESKQHIGPDRAIDKIRSHMYHMPDLHNSSDTRAYIDMKMNKISIDEYRRIIGLE